MKKLEASDHHIECNHVGFDLSLTAPAAWAMSTMPVMIMHLITRTCDTKKTRRVKELLGWARVGFVYKGYGLYDSLVTQEAQNEQTQTPHD
jgi:hypothetical protein